MKNTVFDLWENLNYHEIDNFRPSLTTYILDGEKKRPGVIICPGGGYGHRSKRESEPVAIKFNSAGYNAFVLDYSVAPNKYPKPILDLGRAITVIRENSDDWFTDSDNITVCGFSAGGHLAGSLGVLWDDSLFDDIPGIVKDYLRPNKLVLSYPVITTGEFAHRGSFENLLGSAVSQELWDKMSLELQVSYKTPKTFIWHTVEDASVPVENSLLFVNALREHNVSFEFHLYPHGRHGLSLATADTALESTQINSHVATWIDQCIKWLELESNP